MSLSNYGELRSALIDWLARAPDDEDTVIARIPDFIRLAESRFYRKLRVAENMFRSQAYLNERRERVPPNLLEIDTMVFMEATGDLSTEGKRHEIEYASPAQYNRRFANCSGEPYFYTIVGPEINFGPFIEYNVDAAEEDLGTLEMIYYGTLVSLDPMDDLSTNDILLCYPEIYLFASLVESQTYVVSQQAAVWNARYEQAILDANDVTEGTTAEASAIYAPVAIV